MNKYQEALVTVITRGGDEHELFRIYPYLKYEIDILIELVNKANPKKLDSLYYKVHKKYDEYYVLGHCLACGNEFNISKENKPNYCHNCGQKNRLGRR